VLLAVLCACVLAVAARADTPPDIFDEAGVFVRFFRSLQPTIPSALTTYLADQATAADYAALAPLALAAGG
jgi:hypothetical protein